MRTPYYNVKVKADQTRGAAWPSVDLRATSLGSRRIDTGRVGVGQGREQDAADDREDGRVGADPEGERRDGDEREAGTPSERAGRIA